MGIYVVTRGRAAVGGLLTGDEMRVYRSRGGERKGRRQRAWAASVSDDTV